MDAFIEEILIDVDWRISEMATLKSLPIIYGFKNEHRQQYLMFAIPSVYAIWEGFVKSSLSIYLTYLKQLNIQRHEISLNLLTHIIDVNCKLNQPRMNFDSKKKAVEAMDSIFIDQINIPIDIPTQSNVNYKVIVSLLKRFCIEPIDSKYENELNRLLFFRNTISHGENALIVTESNLISFIALIENIILDIVINIEESKNKKLYIKTMA
jgi:hypothetical protein